MSTSFENAKIHAKSLVSQGVYDRLKPFWDLDEEGEINMIFRDSGVPRLYFAMGNFAQGRFFSKHLALRRSLFSYTKIFEADRDFPIEIKAEEEGLLVRRYSALA